METSSQVLQTINGYLMALLPMHGNRVPRAQKISAVIYSNREQCIMTTMVMVPQDSLMDLYCAVQKHGGLSVSQACVLTSFTTKRRRVYGTVRTVPTGPQCSTFPTWTPLLLNHGTHNRMNISLLDAIHVWHTDHRVGHSCNI